MSRSDRDEKREKRDKHRSDRDDDRDREERRDKKDKDRDRDRSRDKDKDRDRGDRKDRDERREKKEKHRDRDDSRERDRDRDRSDRDRDKDRDRERRDKERDKHRDRDDSRERDREKRDRDKDRERDRSRDHKDRDRDRDRSDRDRSDRDREERREKRDKHRDRDDSRDRSDKKDKRRSDRDDKGSRSQSESVSVSVSRSTTPPPALQNHHSLGTGGIQPSGTFGGNLFSMGGGFNGGLSSTAGNGAAIGPISSSASSKPTGADSILKSMKTDDSDEDEDERERRRRRRERKDKERRNRSKSGSSESESEADRRRRREKEKEKDSRQKSSNNANRVSVDDDDDPENMQTIEASDGPAFAKRSKGIVVQQAADRNQPAWMLRPPAVLQLAFLQREKAGIFSSKGDTFTFCLEPSRKFVLAARRRARKNTPNYLISLDGSDLARDSDKFHGKVRANYAATEYVFYDNGVSPDEYNKALAHVTRQSGKDMSGKDAQALIPKVRREIGAAIFEHPNGGSNNSIIKGASVQPRKIIILLPAYNPQTGEPTRDWCAVPNQGMCASSSEMNSSGTAQAAAAASSSSKKKKKGDDSSDDSDDEREKARGNNNNNNAANNNSSSTLPSSPFPANGSNCFSMLIQTYYNHAAIRKEAVKAAGGNEEKAAVAQHAPEMIVLHNKSPQWNETAKAYQLNFKGRVGQSSVKNFQLVQVSDGGMSKRFGSVFGSPSSNESPLSGRNNNGGKKRGGGSSDDDSSDDDNARRRRAKDKKKELAVRQSMDPDRLRAEMSGLVMVKNVSDDDDSDDNSASRSKDKKNGKSTRSRRRRGDDSDDDNSDSDSPEAGSKRSKAKKGAQKGSPNVLTKHDGGFFADNCQSTHCPAEGGGDVDPEKVVLQFGRRDDKMFSLDFMAPFNAMQAMCVALTSFDIKIGLE